MSSEPKQHLSDGSEGYEKRDSNVNVIVTSIVVGTVILIALVIAVESWFVYEKDKMMYDLYYKHPSPLLIEKREYAKQRLSSYGWVDSTKGIVHIPIEKAMEMKLKEAKSK